MRARCERCSPGSPHPDELAQTSSCPAGTAPARINADMLNGSDANDPDQDDLRAQTQAGNCFTGIADPQRLAQVADTLSQHAAIGRLGQVCDRWIYSACLCFGLNLAGQARSGFAYSYSIYQAEYSRNLLFRSGGQMED